METKKLVPINALAKISPRPACSTSTENVVRERLTRLAELIRKDGAAYPLTPVLVNLWIEVFADLSPQHVAAAFSKAEKSLKFWPSPGEVRAFVPIDAMLEPIEAALKWDTVLAYAVRCSPDYPDKNPPRILPRTQSAINAAGGLGYVRECDRESLTWVRKRFIEAYVRYGELQQSEYLLPEGGVKNLLATAAQKLLASPDVYEEARKRGIAQSAELKTTGCNEPDIQRAMRTIARESAPLPSARSLEEQKQILREKGFLPQAKLGEARP
jgi:hypothetical protein